MRFKGNRRKEKKQKKKKGRQGVKRFQVDGRPHHKITRGLVVHRLACKPSKLANRVQLPAKSHPFVFFFFLFFSLLFFSFFFSFSSLLPPPCLLLSPHSTEDHTLASSVDHYKKKKTPTKACSSVSSFTTSRHHWPGIAARCRMPGYQRVPLSHLKERSRDPSLPLINKNKEEPISFFSK